MALTGMWACAVLLMLNFQLYQASDNQKVTETKASGDSVLFYLISFVENKLEKQQEKHDEEMKQMEEKHDEELYKMDEKHDEELKNAMSQLEEKHVEELKNAISQLEEKQAKKLLDLEQKLQKQLEQHANEINIMKEEQKPPVGFHVVLTKQQSAAPAVIAFDKVITNVGNGWNSISRHFVAPKKGLYMFYLSFLNSWKVKSWAEIRKGYTPMAMAYSYDIAVDMASCAAVIELQKGDHVSAWLQQGQLHSGSYGHFVGFLIHS